MVLKKLDRWKLRWFVSIRLKLLLSFTLLFTIVFAGSYYWFYSYAVGKALQRLQTDLLNTLEGAIAGIEADEFEALALSPSLGQSDLSNSTLHERHQTWLLKVHHIESRAIPYTYIAGDEPNQVLWIGDIYRIIQPDKARTFRESYRVRSNEILLYQGLTRNTITLTPYTDEWGTWISAFGPIRNAQGDIIGAVGIDFQANYLTEVDEGIRDSVIVSFVISYIVLFILVYLVSELFTLPILRLTSVAAKMGEENYHVQELSDFAKTQLRDEISTLAEMLKIMIGKVQHREEVLKQQVADLKIEIDQVKRQKQVNEIVDSEFFKSLQAKARLMRQRLNRPDDAAEPSYTISI